MPIRGLPLLSLDNRFVNLTGDTMTGSLIINPADGTADPLYCVETTGTNQYGFCVDTYDLTGIAYGKYAYIHFLTNGAISNFGVIDSLIIGDINVGGLGQVVGFLNTATLDNMLITAQWDYDGAGNHRMSFNDDVIFTQNIQVDGTISFASLSIGNNTQTQPRITFDAISYDGYLYFNDSGDGQSVGYYFGNAGLTGKGTAGAMTVIGGSRIRMANQANCFIDLSASDDVRMYYSAYLYSPIGSSENAGATAHYFAATGSSLPADGWFMRGVNMADPGHIFGISYWGDLEIGSTETATDHDTYIKIRGKDNSFLATWDQSADLLKVADEVVFEDDVTVAKELKGCRQPLLFHKQGNITSSAYANVASGVIVCTDTIGYRALRPGSITGLAANLNVTAETTKGNITIQARVNDVSVYTLVISSDGVKVVHGQTTQARGTDTFSAGDLITIYIDFTTFVGTLNNTVLQMEIVYDS